jgi:hypothetical protein
MQTNPDDQENLGCDNQQKILPTELNILYMNIRSLTNKLKDLEAQLTELEPHIVILTETWTSLQNHLDPGLHLENYELKSRQDRLNTQGGKGGGVIIFARNDIAAQISPGKPFKEGLDSQLCQIDMGGVSIIAVYRSPNSESTHTLKLLEHLEPLPPNAIIIGDLNYPKIDWNTMRGCSKEGSDFLDFTMRNSLEQHIKTPTHQG